MPYKFKVGDIVALMPAISRNAPGGVYEVVKQLPGTNDNGTRRLYANAIVRCWRKLGP